MNDVLVRLLAGETDYKSLRLDIWAMAHPEAIRQYHQETKKPEERRDKADRKQRRAARRRASTVQR